MVSPLMKRALANAKEPVVGSLTLTCFGTEAASTESKASSARSHWGSGVIQPQDRGGPSAIHCGHAPLRITGSGSVSHWSDLVEFDQIR